MPEVTLLSKVKKAIPITTDAYDQDLTDLIEAAKLDLTETASIVLPDPLDALCERAIITYAKMHFLMDEYAKLKPAYDEQKAQLSTSNRYTQWG